MPFIQIMNTWTRQKGYPVLTLDRNGSTYTVTQIPPHQAKWPIITKIT